MSVCHGIIRPPCIMNYTSDNNQYEECSGMSEAVRPYQYRALPGNSRAVSTIDEALGAGYGLFAGAPKAWAKQRFTRERARRMQRETCHPQQESHTEADGSHV